MNSVFTEVLCVPVRIKRWPTRYSHTDRLQFAGHEEGRTRFVPIAGATPAKLVYDYFLKDHLGNVRMVLTDDQQTDAYPAATMETATAAAEETYYTNLPATRVARPTNFPAATGQAMVAKVSGAAGASKVGPAIILKVMAGDKINLQANSFWQSAATPGPAVSPLNDLILAMATAIAPVSAGKAVATELQGATVLSPNISPFLNSQNSVADRPKAYINWILLDEQFKYVSTGSGFEQVDGSGILKNHTRTNLPVTASGYLYIYVSNETDNIDVFFDNLQVSHVRGPMVEETHYYPFGLTMAGISSKALNGAPENKRKFNSIEYENSFDINIGESFYRSLDPQLGRWWQIDPKPTEMYSPYSAMNNNPILLSDPMGDTTTVYNQNGILLGVVPDKMKNQVHFMKTAGDPGAQFSTKGLSKKQINALGKEFRNNSVAFIGSKTISDARSIVSQSNSLKKELGFVGTIGKDKEIRLKSIPVGELSSMRSTDMSPLDKTYSSSEQNSDLFLWGHTHIAGYLGGWTSGDGSDISNQKGFGEPSRPEDYANQLDRGSQKGSTPALVATQWGVTVYGSSNTPPALGKVEPNNSYLTYKSLKK